MSTKYPLSRLKIMNNWEIKQQKRVEKNDINEEI